MNSLKIATLISGFILIHAAYAQVPNPEHQRIMQKTQLTEPMDLSEKQRGELEKIHEEFNAQLKSISEDENLSKEVKIEGIEKALKVKNEKTDEVYTIEQKAQMNALKREE